MLGGTMSDERKTLAKLEYSIDANDEIYIDISLDDYSEQTIKRLSTLLASISTMSFQIQTVQVAQEAFTKEGRGDELELLVTEMLRKQELFEAIEEKTLLNLDDDDDDDEEDEEICKDNPLIQPTDLM